MEYTNYIDGEWTPSESGFMIEMRNPADRTGTLGTVAKSTEADAEHAIEAAAGARDDWATTPGPA